MKQDVTISPAAAAFARHALLDWYSHSARSFPWRNDRNPYNILIAEMMLRRTQARQVVNVYNQFVSRFPDAITLDQASDDEVTRLLRPLGLNWRASNFKKLAHELVIRHEGKVPQKREVLLALTGVGPYVASAILCFAFKEPSIIVDTNTVRVAARYFGFDYNPESRRRSEVINAVSQLVEEREPVRSNYALLDFAATVCNAKTPDHTKCPLAGQCMYYQRLLNSKILRVQGSSGEEYPL